jgi:plastocyanin
MRKSIPIFLAGLLCAGATLAERITLPAAASIVGGAPFYSDVRAFNTSYTDNLQVTATYRCFIGTCASPAPTSTFTLAPRQSQAFDDMVATTFSSPNTAGGVEFDFSGQSDQLVVTSRLYSTSPQPTVGMFIPALDNSEAYPTTVLTSIRNGGANQGFRTNVGVFNPEDSAVNVTFQIFDETGLALGAAQTRTVPGHSGLQISGIFGVAGVGTTQTENAVIVVSAATQVFSYAAVIDNNTTDPIFVVGAEDNPPQAFTPVITSTPGGGNPSPTQTPSAPAPTVTPTPGTGGVHNVNIGSGGDRFTDSVSGDSTTTITRGTTVHWIWNGFHSTTSQSSSPEQWDAGEHSAGFTFDRQFNNPGTFPYYCTVHGLMMSGTVVVN